MDDLGMRSDKMLATQLQAELMIRAKRLGEAMLALANRSEDEPEWPPLYDEYATAERDVLTICVTLVIEAG
jgi:hypothetical protein